MTYVSAAILLDRCACPSRTYPEHGMRPRADYLGALVYPDDERKHWFTVSVHQVDGPNTIRLVEVLTPLAKLREHLATVFLFSRISIHWILPGRLQRWEPLVLAYKVRV